MMLLHCGHWRNLAPMPSHARPLHNATNPLNITFVTASSKSHQQILACSHLAAPFVSSWTWQSCKMWELNSYKKQLWIRPAHLRPQGQQESATQAPRLLYEAIWVVEDTRKPFLSIIQENNYNSVHWKYTFVHSSTAISVWKPDLPTLNTSHAIGSLYSRFH